MPASSLPAQSPPATVLKVMDRLTGCVFIGFAAKLALSRR